MDKLIIKGGRLPMKTVKQIRDRMASVVGPTWSEKWPMSSDERDHFHSRVDTMQEALDRALEGDTSYLTHIVQHSGF